MNADSEHGDISHSVTLVPRLTYSIHLLGEIVDILKKKRNNLKKLNKDLVTDFDKHDKTHHNAIKLEKTIVFSLEVLSQIKKRTQSYLE